MSFNALRAANTARQIEWDQGDPETFSLEYKGNELAGEAGEVAEHTEAAGPLLLGPVGRACNIIKKLARERLGRPGSRSDRQALAAELADVIICVDLIAMHEDIDLSYAVQTKFNETSEKNGFKTRARLIGRA